MVGLGGSQRIAAKKVKELQDVNKILYLELKSSRAEGKWSWSPGH